ncbi:MAG: hypothetical protein ACK5N0_12800 [Synechococcaceae cyanobacterium]
MQAIPVHAPPSGPVQPHPIKSETAGLETLSFETAGVGASKWAAVAAAETGASTICPRCGGSGTLRMGDQQYRTCLDCLGQGRLAPVPGNRLSGFPSLSAAVGAADAR